jgi:hypothetical protein
VTQHNSIIIPCPRGGEQIALKRGDGSIDPGGPLRVPEDVKRFLRLATLAVLLESSYSAHIALQSVANIISRIIVCGEARKQPALVIHDGLLC